MSEFQYYEFQAIDRPLSEADRQALRELSTRARITATSFTNSYEWGDFKGDPAKLMARWFDLHLYLANWGSRRLMIRLPTRMVDHGLVDAFLGEVDCVALTVAGENLILDIVREEVESEEWDDGTEMSRRARLQAIARRGESVWREIEAEIERRNTTSYDKAGGLLIDLQAIAEEKGVTEDFVRRLQMVRERHARKERFIERLAKFG